MIDNNVAVLTAQDLEGVEFTPEQKLKVEAIMKERLSRLGKAAEDAKTSALEAQRAEFQKHLPGAVPNMDAYLAESEAKQIRENKERTELGKLFGRSGNGMEAQKLKRADPALYKQMRDRAIQLGLVATENRPPAGGTVQRAFEKGALIHRFGERL